MQRHTDKQAYGIQKKRVLCRKLQSKIRTYLSDKLFKMPESYKMIFACGNVVLFERKQYGVYVNADIENAELYYGNYKHAEQKQIFCKIFAFSRSYFFLPVLFKIVQPDG